MSSKLLLLATFLVVASGASGCSMIHESKDKNASSIPVSAPACLDKINGDMTAYFKGTLNDDAKIGTIGTCATGSLQYFMQFTQGKDVESYSSSELRDFLNSYFPATSQVSPVFFHEIMKIKVALFGGTPDRVTRDELRKVSDWINITVRHLIRLKTYMPLDLERNAHLPEVEFDHLLSALHDASIEIGGFFKIAGADYALSDLDSLLVELESYTGGSEKNLIRQFREQLPVVGIAKSLIMGTSDKAIEQTEWPTLMARGARIYGLLLLVTKNSDRFAHWDQGDNLDVIQKVANYGIDLLTDGVASHPNGFIRPETFDRLSVIVRRMKTTPNLASHAFAVQLANAVGKMLFLKSAALGNDGTLDTVTVSRLASLVRDVKGPLKKVAPYLPKFDLTHLSAGERDAAIQIISQALTDAGSAISDFHTARDQIYNFLYLHKITPELLALIDEPMWQDLVRNWDTMAMRVKGVIFGPPYERIHPSQWKDLAGSASSYLRVFQLAQWTQANAAQLTNAEQSELFFRAGEDALNAITETTSKRPLLADEIMGMVTSLPVDEKTRSALQGLVVPVLKLKQALGGGESDRISAADAQGLLNWVRDVKPGVQKVVSLLPLKFGDIAKWPEAKAINLANAFRDLGHKLTQSTGRVTPRPYDLADLDELLAKLQAIDSLKDKVATVRELIPVGGAAKAVISGGSPTRIAPREWAHLFDDAGEYAATATEFTQLIGSGSTFSWGNGLDRMATLLDRGRAALTRSIGYNAAGRSGASEIPYAAWDRLVNETFAYLKLKNIETDFTPKTIRELLRPLFSRILGGKRAWESDVPTPGGLTIRALQRTWSEINRWTNVQRTLQKIYAQFGTPENVYKGYGFRREALLQVIARMLDSPTNDRNGLLAVKSYVETFDPLYLGDDSAASFLYDGDKEYLYSYHQMTLINLLWHGSRVAMLAYAEDAGRATSFGGATRPELLSLLKDTWDLLLETKIMHHQRTVTEIAMQRFRDANLFTAHGNGDSLMDLYEITDLIEIFISGVPMTLPIHNKIADVCPHEGLDDRGRTLINVDCYRKVFWDPDFLQANFGHNFPRMIEHITSLSGEALTGFQRSAEVVARIRGYVSKPVDSVDTDGFVAFFLYVETIMKRFDRDRDGALELSEAMDAFPVFCEVLQNASGFDGNCATGDAFQLDALYGYLLDKGAPPERPKGFWNSIKVGAEWVTWSTKWWTIRKSNCTSCVPPTDRGRITQIISALAGY